MTRIVDPARLAALRESGLMEAGSEEALERLARMAATLLRAPLAQVNFIDDERQFSKSCFAPVDWPGVRDTSLEDSFCKHTVISGEPLIVDDARTHPLVSRSAAVDMGVIAYAGIPLTMADGHTFGTLCVVGFEPRRWTDQEILMLRDLAASVVTEIELRREIARGEQVQSALRQQASLLELAHDCILVRDLNGIIRFWNGGAERVYGWSRDEAIGASSHQLLGTSGPKSLEEIEQEMLRDGLWDGELVHRTRDGSEI
ncbi:MAG: GAF domain-containing protein, partial [Gemmatimonadetes bacterium]|nr:GAF domain-containing protein [Gemmatimonadota bacterium]